MNLDDIPVAVSGPGSQPAEVGDANLDILQLPSGMDTFESPLLPEPEQVAGLVEARRRLAQLRSALDVYPQAGGGRVIDLADLDRGDRDLIDQVLGEGEVSIRIDGETKARIQESVLAGIWRVRRLDDEDAIVSDVIEIAEIPSLVSQTAFGAAAVGPRGDADELPEGVLNAPSLLTEIADKVAGYRPGAGPHVINLTLLPQTEQDLAFLADRLGEGGVTILSRGYGNCRISSTATPHVWWVQYFNSQDRNILNTLEVTGVPSVACAATEDIRDSAARLREILEIYQ